jgi:uncharacterized lipoprotein YmbA
MKLKNTILFLSLSFILVACFSSRPTTFYLLRAIETSKPGHNKPQLEKITVFVKPVKFPEYLDRPQMIIRENEYKLQFSENHRWAEPLKDNFTQVFIENLNTRLAPGNAIMYSELHGLKPDTQLSIEVLRMDVDTNYQAVLRVKWTLLTEKNGRRIKRLRNEYNIPVEDKSYESAVEAQSKAIAQFADQVAATIETIQKYSTTHTLTPTR